MKNIAKYLLIYNFACLCVLTTQWYSEVVSIFGITDNRYNFIDLLDTPFYILGLFVFFIKYTKLSKLQKVSFYTCILYLLSKNLFNFDLMTFDIVNLSILSIPICYWVYENYNYNE